MLVLSRKRGETIQIGTDILVTVVRIGPNNVRLGITAPRATTIVRDELPHRVLGFSREERLGIALQNLCDDVAAGDLDSESLVTAGELLEELGVATA